MRSAGRQMEVSGRQLDMGKPGVRQAGVKESSRGDSCGEGSQALKMGGQKDLVYKGQE